MSQAGGMWLIDEALAYRMLLILLMPGSTPACTRVRARMRG